MKPLSPDFFNHDVVEVAKDLLGKVMMINGIKTRIVETEAYGRDPASHAFKRTERSTLMFDTYAHVYVYLIYGMYYCINFTTNGTTEAGAVLIRAVEPLTNIKELQERRKTENIFNLCSGPGKLCQALQIDKSFNGLPIGDKVTLYDDKFIVEKIVTSPRIGIKDALDLHWRFFIEGNKFVSIVK